MLSKGLRSHGTSCGKKRGDFAERNHVARGLEERTPWESRGRQFKSLRFKESKGTDGQPERNRAASTESSTGTKNSLALIAFSSVLALSCGKTALTRPPRARVKPDYPCICSCWRSRQLKVGEFWRVAACPVKGRPDLSGPFGSLKNIDNRSHVRQISQQRVAHA